jgi:hypothetical protein
MSILSTNSTCGVRQQRLWLVPLYVVGFTFLTLVNVRATFSIPDRDLRLTLRRITAVPDLVYLALGYKIVKFIYELHMTLHIWVGGKPSKYTVNIRSMQVANLFLGGQIAESYLENFMYIWFPG